MYNFRNAHCSTCPKVSVSEFTIPLGRPQALCLVAVCLPPPRALCSLKAILDFDARASMGKDVVKTTKSDHEKRTSFFLATPSLKAAGCSVDPVVIIARCRVVMCILHRYMALGWLQMANIEWLANDQLAPGD